jgi:uncharacterized membrane protein YphA (DoxX/SURF4 family)
MATNTQPAAGSKAMVWTGRIISLLVVVMMLFSGVMKLMKPEALVTEFTRLELKESLAIALGILEITCTVIYAIPQTSVLGAILLTGYYGGAILTHVRIGDQFVFPIIGGILVWLGLFLRDYRIRALIPFRK